MPRRPVLTPSGSPADRERVLLGGAVFAVMFAQLLVYPGVDTLVTALGAPAVLGGSTWFLAVELGASVLFVWVWGLASDARGVRVPLLRAGALLAAASYGALAVLPQVTALPFPGALAIRAVQGAATIGVLSLAMTMLMDLPGGHGRNMGAAGIAIGAGTALGAPVGGLLYGRGPFVPLAAAALLALAVAALSVRLADRTPSGERSRPGRGGLASVLEPVRATPGLVVPYAFGFIDRLSAGVFALAGTLYFRTVFELSPAATGAMLFLFFAPFALFQYPFGALSDRLGRARPVVLGSVGYGLGVAAVGLAPTVATVGAAMVAVGVVGALMSPATMALVTDLAGEADRGVAMAGFNATGNVGFLAGVVLAGTVAGAAGFTTVFVLAGAIEIALAAVAARAVFRLAPTRTEDSIV
jgi:MFS family permease